MRSFLYSSEERSVQNSVPGNPYVVSYNTPAGLLRLRAKGGYLTGVEPAEAKADPGNRRLENFVVCSQSTGEIPQVLMDTMHQLQLYFQGKIREFHLPLSFQGTLFQEKVWQALTTIPYGETRSYGEIARQVGSPGGSRAVGGANHKNPLMIVIPCHRVIGADGSLTGFGAGLPVKKYLLELEQEVLRRTQ